MQFSIKTPESVLGLGRLLGYRLLGDKGNEYNFVRGLGPNHYPRFHLYVRDGGGILFFNLHLDQKAPSYGGHTAHSGEYDGDLIEKEIERIRTELVRRN